MKTLTLADTGLISGGESLTCTEALMKEFIFEEDISFTDYCTKEQFIAAASSFANLVYNPEFLELIKKGDDSLMGIKVIQWLGSLTV